MQNLAHGRWTRARIVLQTLGLIAGGLLLLQQVISAVQAVLHSEVHLQNPLYIVAALAMSTLAGGVQIIGWLVIMRWLGARLTWGQAVRGYNLSFLPRYIPGSIWGYLSRSEWLWRYHDVTYSVSNIGSILEVYFILLAGAAFGLAIGLPLLTGVGPIGSVGSASALLLGAFLALRYLPKWQLRSTNPLSGILKKVPFVTPGKFMSLMAFYVSLWLCHGGMLYFLARSLGYISETGYWHYVLAYDLAWTGGFLVLFVPAGFGVRDTLLSRLLVSFIGLLAAQAVVVAILARLSGLAGEITWLGVSLTIAQPAELSAKTGANTD